MCVMAAWIILTCCPRTKLTGRCTGAGLGMLLTEKHESSNPERKAAGCKVQE